VIASLPGNLAIVQVADPAAWTLVSWVGDAVTFTGRADPAVGAPVCLIEAPGVAGRGSVEAVDFSVEFPDGVVNPRRRDRRARRPGRPRRHVRVRVVGRRRADRRRAGEPQLLSAYGLQLSV
jgi:hypothetical protein